MYLIVGLGNPEPEYSYTRHNMGFDTINKISEKYDIKVNKNGFKAIYGKGKIEDEDIILLKPQTYMNLSGDSVIEAAKFYKISPENIVIIFDDIDIETGIIKLRKKGGPGTHNGMKSVVYRLGTEDFPRVRIGTGFCEQNYDLASYVLKKLTKEEYNKLEEGINKAEEAVVEILKNGFDTAMNKFN